MKLLNIACLCLCASTTFAFEWTDNDREWFSRVNESIRTAVERSDDIHVLSPIVRENIDYLQDIFRRASEDGLFQNIPPSRENLNTLFAESDFSIETALLDRFWGDATREILDGETHVVPLEIFSIAYSMALSMPDNIPMFLYRIEENYSTRGGCIPGIVNRLFIFSFWTIANLIL